MDDLPLIAPADDATGLPETPMSLGRINVVLGLNGTGKTRLLKSLRDVLQSVHGAETISFKGTRQAQFPAAVQVSQHERLQAKASILDFQDQYAKEGSSWSSRLTNLLKKLELQRDLDYRLWANEMAIWDERGRNGTAPLRPEDRLTSCLDAFGRVFPNIKLSSIAPDPMQPSLTRQINAVRGVSAPYPVYGLSAGESQILSVLAEVELACPKNAVFLVDEPALNLDASLALRFWREIEATRPDSRMVYATHQPCFGLREDTDKVFILSRNGAAVEVHKSLGVLSPEDRRSFVGAIKLTLGHSYVFAFEGEEGGFDDRIYPWIVGNPTNVAFVPRSSCEDVIRLVRGEMGRGILEGGSTIVGAIDRDYRLPKEVQSIERDGLIVLSYHEIESYLCHPDVIVAIARTLPHFNDADRPGYQDIVDQIILFAEEKRWPVLLYRVLRHTRSSVYVEASRRELSTFSGNSVDEVLEFLKGKLDAAAKAATDILDISVVRPIVDREIERISTAIAGRDVEALLRMIPGKELLPRIASLLQYSKNLLIEVLVKQFRPDEFVPIKKLAKKIRESLQLPAVVIEKGPENCGISPRE